MCVQQKTVGVLIMLCRFLVFLSHMSYTRASKKTIGVFSLLKWHMERNKYLIN